MTQALRTLLLVAVLFLCAGCFFWAYSHPGSGSSRTDVDDKTLESIIVGSTTIEDILLRLGEPEEHYDAPTVFLYRWVRVKGFFFFGVAPSRAGGVASESTTEYTLHIAFDENDKVSRYKLSKTPLSIR